MANYVSNQEIREQAGFQYKERGEILETPDGITVVFYTDNKPIVERRYGSTPVSADDVVVYVTGVATPISAIDAVQGKITLNYATTNTPLTIDYDWSNLAKEVLQKYADEAHALVLSAVGNAYSLPLSETPDLLKLIEKKLAAGLLLDKEYSGGGEGTGDTRGQRWIKWAEAKLKEIASGNLQLLNSSGDVLSGESSVLDGWPDRTTKDASKTDGGGKTHFRIKDQF